MLYLKTLSNFNEIEDTMEPYEEYRMAYIIKQVRYQLIAMPLATMLRFTKAVCARASGCMWSFFSLHVYNLYKNDFASVVKKQGCVGLQRQETIQFSFKKKN